MLLLVWDPTLRTRDSEDNPESGPKILRALEQHSDKLFSKGLGTLMGAYSIPFKVKIQLRHVIKELNTVLKQWQNEHIKSVLNK